MATDWKPVLARAVERKLLTGDAARKILHTLPANASLDEVAGVAGLGPGVVAALVLSILDRTAEQPPTTALFSETIVAPEPQVPGGPPAQAMQKIGKFDILELAGIGGMATVHKARDRESNRIVALKLLLPPPGEDQEEAVERFRREARLAARLDHPAVVPVLDAGCIEGRLYLAMEYIEGKTLAQWLDDTRPAKRAGQIEGHRRLREELAVLVEVADVVAFAHKHGVVHRDLKPSNVLLDRQLHAFITDFGLAKEIEAHPSATDRDSRLTRTGFALGTPGYMSPEQVAAQGRRIGPPADLWSLGVMLYEILTGRLPFERPTTIDILVAVRHDDPKPPREVHPHVPADLQALCMAVFEKNPDERPMTVREFADDLRRWLRGEPLRAARRDFARRAQLWFRRRRGRLLLASVATVLLGTVALWIRLERGHADERTLTMLREIVTATSRLEDTLHRVPMPLQGRREVAAQPLSLLNIVVAGEPEFGPAYSWRGLVQNLVGQDALADADLDRGCALSPEDPEVWYLRAAVRLERWLHQRGLSAPRPGDGGVGFDPLSAESPAQQALREGGLADLNRFEASRGSAVGVQHEHPRAARAMAALVSVRLEDAQRALELLERATGPREHEIEGRALYRMGRFPEAAKAFGLAVALWPRHAPARVGLGLAHLACAMTPPGANRTAADAAAALDRAVDDLADALTLFDEDALVAGPTAFLAERRFLRVQLARGHARHALLPGLAGDEASRRRDLAFAALQPLPDLGWTGAPDPDFAGLTDDPRWAELTARVKK